MEGRGADRRPGAGGGISRRARNLSAAVLAFLAVTAVRVAVDEPGEAVGMLYVLPVGLVAVELGRFAGAAAGAGAVAAVGLMTELSDSSIGTLGYVSRAAALIGVGFVVGLLVEHRQRDVDEAQRWFSISSDLLAVLGRGGRFIRVNDAWTGTLGYTAEDLLGRSHLELVHPDDAGAAEATAERLNSGKGAARLENRVRAKDGGWHWFSWSMRSEEGRIYAAAREVSERKQLEVERELLLKRVQAMAHTDGLTGLPNRRAWDDELRRELARARRSGTCLAVAMIDLDHFKQFNDAHGHQAGDEFLREAALAWRACVRASDVLARYGGEEFCVLFADCCEGVDAQPLLERIRTATPIGLTCSAGLAVWDGEEEASDLVRRADVALYAAKEGGRDRSVLAEPPPRGADNPLS